MKQLIKLIYLLFIWMVISTNAQNKVDLEIYKSKIEELKGVSLIDAASMPNGDIFVYDYIKNRGGRIRHFDAKLNLIKQKYLSNIINEKDYKYQGCFINKNGLNLIFLKDSKTELVFKVFYGSIDELDLKHEKTIVSINKNNLDKYSLKQGVKDNTMTFPIPSYYEDDNDIRTAINFSSNKNYFSLILENNNNKNISYLVYVFDTDLNQTLKRNISIHYTDDNFNLKEMYTSDIDGSVYLLSYIYKDKRRDKLGNFHYEIYKINNDDFNKIIINLSDNYLDDDQVRLTGINNMLFFTGLYGNKKFNTRGVFRFNIKTDDFKIQKQIYSPFRDKIYFEKLIHIKKGKENKKQLKNLELKRVFVDKEYNIYLNIEEVRMSRTVEGYSSTMEEVKDIVAVKIDLEGNFVWEKNINKMQYNPIGKTDATGLYSYYSVVVNNKNYFFVNVKKISKIKKINSIMLNGGKPSALNLFVFIIDNNGDLSYQKIVDSKDSKIRFKVLKSKFLKEIPAVLIPGNKKKKNQLLEVKLK